MEDRKIVIVDDDPDYTAAVKAILEGEQYSVIVANDRNEGLEKVKNEKPALIILDVISKS